MNPADYLIPRPPMDVSAYTDQIRNLFDGTPRGRAVDYTLSLPKWQFLNYLCETRNLVLHGSQIGNIDTVEPRQANDIRAFSNQRAIYATTDGIWAIFFAIIDRRNHKNLSLFNSCLQARIDPDTLTDPMYFFSITQSVRLQAPYCNGTIYILNRDSFYQEPPQTAQGMEIIFPHWISHEPAVSVMRLEVTPDDFPFLQQIHGHDDAKLVALARENPEGFPWPEALID